MKMKQFAVVLFLLLSPFIYSQGVSISNIELSNPLQMERTDESFVITRSDLKAVRTTLVPILLTPNGDTIASQLDDMDGDKRWDELAFTYTLKSLESVKLTVKWIAADKYPVFPVRTNIRYGKMTSPGHIEELTSDYRTNTDISWSKSYPYQMDGIAWENDKMGFRHYFDGRNNRDVFGKCISTMALDTVGIGKNGAPANTYQVEAPWGRDILNVGSSFGLGGLAIASEDTIVQLGNIKKGIEDNVDSTMYHLITEGPVRSVFQLDHTGWNVNNQKINLSQRITIWAGKHNYENVITVDPLPAGFQLITGIVRLQNKMPLVHTDNNSYHSMLTHDKQTIAPLKQMGMALVIPSSNYVTAFDTPDSGTGILSTWCAKLIPNKNKINFDVYATWEQQDSRFADREYFIRYIQSEVDKKSIPVRVILK
jgi:hypothetical protein